MAGWIGQSSKAFSISAIYLFHFLTIHIFLGASYLISPKNFALEFTNLAGNYLVQED